MNIVVEELGEILHDLGYHTEPRNGVIDIFDHDMAYVCGLGTATPDAVDYKGKIGLAVAMAECHWYDVLEPDFDPEDVIFAVIFAIVSYPFNDENSERLTNNQGE